MENSVFCPLIKGPCIDTCVMRMGDECFVCAAMSALTVFDEVDPLSMADAVATIASLEVTKYGELTCDTTVRGTIGADVNV